MTDCEAALVLLKAETRDGDEARSLASHLLQCRSCIEVAMGVPEVVKPYVKAYLLFVNGLKKP